MTIKERNLIVGPITFVLLMWFAHVMHIKRTAGAVLLAVCLPYAVLFLVADVLYNWTVGSFLFMEFPRELLYTDRLHRHAFSTTATNSSVYAQDMCILLNRYDEGHCK